ncbi:MAG: DUF2155 domain-containing protein, partial [Alphaproteobacteria bacterium]
RADIATDTVVLRTMDKITGRVQKLTASVGEQTKVGSLSVFVEKCLKKPPEETPENAAFLIITDENDLEKPVFRGWMFSSNPALSAMEHPVYDIWVVECTASVVEEKPIVENSPALEEPVSDEPIED